MFSYLAKKLSVSLRIYAGKYFSCGFFSKASSRCFISAAWLDSGRNQVAQVVLQCTFLSIMALMILSNIAGSICACTSAVSTLPSMRADIEIVFLFRILDRRVDHRPGMLDGLIAVGRRGKNIERVAEHRPAELVRFVRRRFRDLRFQPLE